MDTEEISDIYVAPCFVNVLESYEGEINLGKEENMISYEFAVKLCLDHEVKCGHKVVKKELIVALRGEIYFVKFIINPEEDDVEPGVVLGRSFMRLTKGIADFGNETITIYPELDPFLDSSRETEKIDDDWDLLLDDLDFEDILEIKGVEILSFVCKMGKNSRNKRKKLEKYQMIYFDIGPSLSTEKPLTQEEAAREALAIIFAKDLLYWRRKHQITSTYDGICHQTFHTAKTSLNTEESDNDDEEDYGIQWNKFGAQVYGPKPDKKICVGKKAVSFLGYLPVALQREDWKPKYKGNHCKKEEGDGQWHTEIRLTNPYGNVND
ncbi:hypothetical protein Tco_0381466 [Tanacetum coccineum]